MTIWHWVRHGPTHEKNFVGHRDVPADLSDTAALARLRAFLPSKAIMISSDLVRAAATADAVMGAGHLRLPHDPNLRELDFGAWDGLHFSEVQARDPVLSRAYWETPGDIEAPGGESWNAARARVSQVVDALNATYPDRHIIAVAHFGVILGQVQRALGVSPTEAMAHRIENLSVTEIHWTGDRGRVERISHLA